MISTLDVVSGGRVGARDRRRLEGGRVARLRVRVPRGARAAGDPGRSSRGHHPDARARARHVRGEARQRPRRDPRAQGAPGPAHPDHGRRQRTQGHLAACGALRRRAQPRRVDARGGGRGPAGHRRATAPRSVATRRRCACRSTSADPPRCARPGNGELGREYEGLGIDRLILQGFAEVTQPGVLESFADDAALGSASRRRSAPSPGSGA